MERTCSVFKAFGSDGIEEHLHGHQSKLQGEVCKPGRFLTGRAQVEVWEWWSHNGEQYNFCALKVL